MKRKNSLNLRFKKIIKAFLLTVYSLGQPFPNSSLQLTGVLQENKVTLYAKMMKNINRNVFRIVVGLPYLSGRAPGDATSRVGCLCCVVP